MILTYLNDEDLYTLNLPPAIDARDNAYLLPSVLAGASTGKPQYHCDPG